MSKSNTERSRSLVTSDVSTDGGLLTSETTVFMIFLVKGVYEPTDQIASGLSGENGCEANAANIATIQPSSGTKISRTRMGRVCESDL